MLKRNFKHVAISILLSSLHAFSSTLLADGGGRREITPYQPNSPITVAAVSTQKRLGDSSMTLTYNGGQCANVGLAYAKNDQIRGPVSHRLVGTTDGGASASVDFSVIERMTILRVDESPAVTKALFRVSAFPVITPAQLVNTRPTFSELMTKYRKDYEIWVEIKNNAGSLSMTSPSGQGATRNDLCAKLESIPTGSEMSFTYGELKPVGMGRPHFNYWEGRGRGLWWAIPSVIRDTNYPYKRPAMAS